MKILIAILSVIISSIAFSADISETNIENFLNKKEVAIYIKSKLLKSYSSDNFKTIKINSIQINVIGEKNYVKGLNILIYEKYGNYYNVKTKIKETSYIDYDEIPILISNLKKIWNHTYKITKNESGILTVATRSGFSITIMELF